MAHRMRESALERSSERDSTMHFFISNFPGSCSRAVVVESVIY